MENDKTKKENLLNKKYISLIKNKNSPLINKLKCEKRNFSKAKYSFNSGLSYDVNKLFKNDTDKILIRIVKMIQYKTRKLLFVLKNEDLLIYELKEEPFSLIFIKTMPKTQFFSIDLDTIKYFYCFKYQNSIMFNFLSLKQIKTYEFNPDNNEFILKETKDYSNDRFNKYFCYMKKTDQFIIFKYNEIILCDNLFSSNITLIKIDEEEERDSDTIRSCKELSKNLLCIIFNHSISLYNLELDKDKDKLIGSIKEIRPQSVKLIDNQEQKYIIILTYYGIHIFDFKDLKYIKQLDIDELKNIRKIKVLGNSDIAIIYGDYNLAIYDIKLDMIKYRIKNEEKINQMYKSTFFLKNLDDFTLLYNPTRYSLNAINYNKGETLAKFSDGHNRIIRCRKIHFINFDDDNIIENENKIIKYYLVINIKGCFILTIKK